MNESTVRHGRRKPRGRKHLLLGIIAIGTIMLFSAIAIREPLLAIAATLALISALAITIWPDVPTFVFLFVLYSNAAVVAMQFHNVPFIIGASVPVLLTVPLAYHVIVKRERIIFGSVLYLMVIFLLIQVLAALFAEEIKLEILITFAVEGIALYFLLLNAIRTPKALRFAIWALLLAGLFLGGLSFFQEITETHDNNYGGFAQVGVAFDTGEEDLLGEVTRPRLEGPIGDSNRYAQTLLVLLPLALLRFRNERSKWLRLLAVASAILILFGVALTFSRASVVAIVLLIVAMVFMRYIRAYQLVIVLVGIALLPLIVPSLGVRLLEMESLVDFEAADGGGVDAMEGADSSTKSRVTEMLAAVLMFADNPVLGVGPGLYPRHYQEYAKIVGLKVKTTDRQSHFLYGGLAAETGVFGLITFGLIVLITMRDLWRTRRRWKTERPEYSDMATGFMLAIFAYLITGIFLHFAYIRFFWVLMGVAGAAIQVYQSEAGRLSQAAEPKATRNEVGLTAPRSAS